MSRPALKLVDPATGELVDPGVCPHCARAEAEGEERENVIVGLKVTLRSQAGIIGRHTRDPEAAIREHHLWSLAERLFNFWREQTGHTGTEFTTDRFKLVLPYLQRKTHGPLMVARGITGIGFDPFVKQALNGKPIRYDLWKNLLKDCDTFEQYCNKAPRDWRERVEPHSFPEKAPRADRKGKAKALRAGKG